MRPYYEDSHVTIYHGDCREVGPSVLRDSSVDLMLTDPPFFMPTQHYASRAKWQRSWGDTSILAQWWDSTVALLVPKLKATGAFTTFCDDESYAVFYPAIYRRFDNMSAIVWDKGRMGMGARRRHQHELLIEGSYKGSKWRGGATLTDVLGSRSVHSSERLHPVDKPTDLLAQLIEPATDRGDLVCDPFLGGGSTALAAKILGRKFVGIEIEEQYCEIAAKRVQGALDLSWQEPEASAGGDVEEAGLFDGTP